MCLVEERGCPWKDIAFAQSDMTLKIGARPRTAASGFHSADCSETLQFAEMQRSDFVKFCAASAAAAGTPDTAPRMRRQTLLRTGQALGRQRRADQASAVPAESNLIVHYVRTTPNASASTSRSRHVLRRAWSPRTQACLRREGRGRPRPSIVALPPRSASNSSPIRQRRSFHQRPQREKAPAQSMQRHPLTAPSTASTIPATAPRVVAGHAPQPLADLLEHEQDDELTAVGTPRRREVQPVLASTKSIVSLQGGAPRSTAATSVVHEADGSCRQR